MPRAPKIMTFAEYARHRCVTSQQVRNWYTQHLVVCVGKGRIDVAKSDANLAERDARKAAIAHEAPELPAADSAYSPDEVASAADALARAARFEGKAPYSKTEAERIKENYLALQRQLEFEKAAGEVVEVARVAAAVAGEYAIVRTKLLGVGATIAPTLAITRTPEECKAIIDAAIVRALEDLTLDDPDSAHAEADAVHGRRRIANAKRPDPNSP